MLLVAIMDMDMDMWGHAAVGAGAVGGLEQGALEAAWAGFVTHTPGQ